LFGHPGGYRSRDVREERVIGVDLGGTKILAGLVLRDGTIGRTIEIATPDGDQAAVLGAIDGVVEDLLADGASAIGYGVPLNIDRRTGVALRAVNLPLNRVHFSDRARERYSLPAGVENDGNAAALAEWHLGAGRGVSDLIMLTLGTGVGGGLVIDDHLYRGWAELGHTVVVAGGQPCQGTCHGHGHLEAHASGLAADRAAATLFGPGADAPVLVERARAGDAGALAALGEIGRLLGAAIGSLVNIFDPDVVIIGGGFGAAAGDLVLEPARVAARAEAIQPADETLRIVEAELGDEAGLIGAGLVAFEALDGKR
jgi:glucokinase